MSQIHAPVKISSPKKTFSGKFMSTVLSTGEKFTGESKRTKPLTIDRSNANPLLRKQVASDSKGTLNSFNMFKPLTVNGTVATHGGKRHPEDAKATVYTDPFAADRVRYQPPEKKLLENTNLGGPRVLDKERKHVRGVVEDGQYKEKIITANGVVRSGGKHQPEDRTATTFDKPDPKANINYASWTRFKKSSLAREDQMSGQILSPTSKGANGNNKSFPKGSNSGTTHAGHGGIKHVAGSGDTQNSLVGVLRLDTKKAARSYDYAPPWGCTVSATSTPGTSVHNTPTPGVRVDGGSSRAHIGKSHASPSPWATELNAKA